MGYKKVNFLSYNESIKYVHKLNIRSGTEWKRYCKKGIKPKNIPFSPDYIYKNDGWISWKEWLGYNERKRKGI